MTQVIVLLYLYLMDQVKSARSPNLYIDMGSRLVVSNLDTKHICCRCFVTLQWNKTIDGDLFKGVSLSDYHNCVYSNSNILFHLNVAKKQSFKDG